jgi:hypothetical protein
MSNYALLQFAASVPGDETPSEAHSEDVAIAMDIFLLLIHIVHQKD